MSASVVLITGALTGIGRATALAFARDRAHIVVSGRNEAAGLALVDELSTLGAEAAFQRADVTREAEVEALVAFTLSRFGRLDVAVNNAGTEGHPAPLADDSEANYRATFDTNVLGTLLCLKHELKAMTRQASGSIINLSSIVGHVGMAGAGVYTASKHAVEGLTKSAALEVAPLGIRVNAVAPGPILTPMLNRFTGGSEEAKAGLFGMIPAQRGGSPDEIAETILFLASNKSPYLTGQIIAVDGAYTAQ